MKTLFFIPVLIFTLLSCSKSDNDNSIEPSVVGKWKQIELYNSDGGSSPNWHTVTNGYTIEFLSNGTFNSTKHTECSTGKYTISSINEITLTYDCTNFTNKYIEKQENLTNAQLILKPAYMNCDEGCSVKFTKVN
jgi:hypothetical protein